MTAIILHGAAATKFGGPFNLDVRSASEAIRALCKLVPGFMEHMKGHDWRIIRGTTKSAVREGRDTSKEELPIGLGRHQELHIIPVIGGAAGKSGIGKVVAGVVVIVASVFTGGAAAGAFGAAAAAAAAAAGSVGITASGLAMFGASLLLGGISQMLAPNPKSAKVETREDSTQRTSTLFNGPVNLGELGQAIPLCYSGNGEVLCGTVVASAGIFIQQVSPTA
jgi:predicted phage tail protein